MELKSLSEIPSLATFPHTYRWASHIIALTGISAIAKGTSSTKAATAPVAASSTAKAEDFDDLFGDDEEEEEVNDDGENAAEAAATKARQARMVSMQHSLM